MLLYAELQTTYYVLLNKGRFLCQCVRESGTGEKKKEKERDGSFSQGSSALVGAVESPKEAERKRVKGSTKEGTLKHPETPKEAPKGVVEPSPKPSGSLMSGLGIGG
jgi:hypothetical protein